MENSSHDRRLKDALIRPQSIALIGASDDAGKVSGRPLAFLKANNTTAKVFPINPNRATVQGVPAFQSISDIDEPVEHAYILLNSDAAVEAVAECAEADVTVATVLADGFAEAGAAGLARQNRLLEIAHQSGIRIVGPNSMGIANPETGFICTTNAAFAAPDLVAGRYGVLSQSGSIIGTLLSRGHASGVHFSFFVSLGNEADLGLGEVGTHLADDEDTDAFILFMETIRRPDDIAEFAEAARKLGKPLIAYKLGRSPLAEELAVSHTGAIVGTDAAAECFFRHHGIHRVDLFETVFELPNLLISSRDVSPGRPKSTTVVTTTGGGGAMVVDRLGVLDIDVVGASREARAILSEQGINLSEGRLIDVSLAGANYDTMKAVMKTLIDDPMSGSIVVAIGSSAQFFPELAVHPIIDAVKEIGPGGAPVIGFPVPHAPEAIQLLSRNGIASARTVESCAESVARYLDPLRPTPSVTSTGPSAVCRGVTAVLDQGDGGILNEVRAGQVLEALGIVRPRQLLLAKGEQIPDHIEIGFPVAVKVVSDDLPHKTEAGAVRLNIANRDMLVTAVAEMLGHVTEYTPTAVITGVLVQEMISGRAEVMLGVTRDPAVGATTTLAVGGTLAEIYKDFTMRMVPVDIQEVREMVEEVKGLAIIRGYRNLPPGDIDALVETIVNFSQIAADERVMEAEINPLIVGAKGEGCFAVDALISLEDSCS